MQKIIPFLWFENNAEDAVNYYTSLFNNSMIFNISRYDKATSEASGMTEGTVLDISFQLEGQEFGALNGGPQYSFSPAISFFVNCKTEEEVNHLWNELSNGGKVLMELNKYPFSERYGWIQDKFGVSWQLSLGTREQKITPSLLFVGDQFGKGEEAINFYTSIFKDSSIKSIDRSKEGEEMPVGSLRHAVFSLFNQEFIAMESNLEHDFSFNQAISFLVNCESQEEVDEYWEKLTREGKESICGWLEDKYGVPWQIVPTILNDMLQDEDKEKAERVMKAMLKMGKIEIKGLRDAYEGNN